MSEELSTSKYYASSNEDVDQASPRRRNGNWNRYLTTICILFAVSSVIGALSAAKGFYSLNKPIEETAIARTAAERSVQKIELAQQYAIGRYYPMLMYNEAVKLILAGALMFSAVYLVSQNPKARSFAIGVCGLALFFNVSSLVVAIMMIGETGGAVNSMLDDVFSNVQGQDAAQKAQARELAENTIITTVTVMMAVVFLIKLMYYGVIVAYLWSDDVKKIFGEDPLAYMEKEAAEQAARTGITGTA